jgi:Protein of unknwon function (DUF3310)
MGGDSVNHPSHYQGKKFECIDIIERYRLGFHLGNAFKYLCRYKNKNGRQDVEKALWYISRYLEIANVSIDQENAWGGMVVCIPAIEVVRDFEIEDTHLMSAALRILMAYTDDLSHDFIETCKSDIERYLSGC